MISADFYPTAIINPVTGLEVTDVIANLQLSEPSNAYWLGWIKPENIPDSFLPSNWALSNTALTFSIIGKDANHNFGYISMYTTSATIASTIQLYPTDPITAYNSPRYINKFDVMGGGSLGNLFCNLGVLFEYGVSSDNITHSLLRTTSTSAPFNIDAVDFFNDTATINVSVQITGSSYYTKEIKYSDFNDDGYVVDETTFEESGVTYFLRATIFILGYRFGFLRDVTEASRVGAYTNALPSIDITANEKRFVTGIAGWGTSVLEQRVNKTGAFTNALWTNGFYGNYGFINFGVNGSIPLTDIAKNPVSTLIPHSIHGNIFVYNVSTNYTELYRFYTPDEIRKNFCLLIRVTRGSTVYGYNDTENYAPYVTEDNEFTATLITGDLSDDEFKAKLRPWQYDVDEWAENDYTEEDLPPYEPEGDDDPTTSGGDDHLPRRGFSIGGTGGFVTQYALSYSQLHEFANMLWAQFGDADFISNIGTTFLNDYSIKPSDILNYIVSMRVYPFNLADSVSYTDTQSNNIFIGRGVFPYILTSGNTHVIADTCETFDGGYCDVPTYYNDFRDYEPASSIEVYVPYCGSVSISPSEVVGKRLRLTYGVDYSTGALSATLWVISDTNYTLAVLSGQVAASIQMSASNEMDGILRLTSIAGTIGKAMLANDKIDASKMSDSLKTIAKTSNAVGTAGDVVNAVSHGLPVHSIGNTNGFSNFATPPRACITISYHKYKNPENFAHVYGNKCNRRETLGSLNGYTKCKNVDVSGFTCHEDERSEIKALLESGVYL